jgi:hypothetical protein
VQLFLLHQVLGLPLVLYANGMADEIFFKEKNPPHTSQESEKD